jgi:phosphoenolpyruvate---glycerone phosphotransferase subunit DhaK
MRKLINDPFACVDEMIGGLKVAFPGLIEVTPTGRGLVFTKPAPGRRTAIITGGGSGHEPAFYGYLGRGLADGAAIGNVFASPPAEPAIEIAERLRLQGADGVLFVYGNYDGDIMNFGMAADFLADRGIPCETVLVTDDVASAPATERSDRRGVAGNAIVVKAAGARADEGAGLEEVAEAARHANSLTRTVGVGLGPCTVPIAGVPTFELPEGEMDIGMGIHGERGIRRTALAPADAVADELLALILDDGAGDLEWPFLVLVNTLGATPLMEAMIVLRRVAARLGELGFEVARALVGEYVTALEMSGLSLTLTGLEPELERLLSAPARALHAPRVSWDAW